MGTGPGSTHPNSQALGPVVFRPLFTGKDLELDTSACGASGTRSRAWSALAVGATIAVIAPAVTIVFARRPTAPSKALESAG